MSKLLTDEFGVRSWVIITMGTFLSFLTGVLITFIMLVLEHKI